MKHVELNNDGVVATVRTAPYPNAENPITTEAPDTVECGWTYADGVWTEPSELIAARTRMVWSNASAFLAEFTMAELAAVQLSTDPTLAALRLILAAWVGEVYSDDARVQAGVAAIAGLEIITQERADAILTKH